MTPRLRAFVTATACVLFSTCMISAAFAQEESDDSLAIGYQPAWYAMTGVTGGASFQEPGTGGYVGAEFSVVRLMQRAWVGGYLDATWDFGPDYLMVTAGPEVGYGFAGFDGGAGLRYDGDEVQFGPQGRFLLTVGIVSLYGRYAYWPDPDSHTIQAGAMFKLPVASW